MEQPPGTVWESLFARKTYDISLRKNKGSGHSRTLNNSMLHAPIINYYMGMEGSSRKRRRLDKQWEGDSSSEDSSKQSDLERGRLREHTSQKIPQSSPPIHEDVHLYAYKVWYNSKYTHIDDVVSEEDWDRLEAEKLSIPTIKGLTIAEFRDIGIALGIGKNIVKRASLFESKVIRGEWKLIDS
jgi:hypothetical protein